MKFKSVLPTILAGAMLFSGVAFAMGEEDLLRAFAHGNKDAAVEILSNNPNVSVNIVDGNCSGATLLHYAACMNWNDVAEMVLRRNPMLVNISAYDGDTPLHTAVKKGNLDVVRVLLARGANVNLKNGVGLTPLHSAACMVSDRNSHQNEIIDLLLATCGIDVNVMGVSGETPIHFAAELGNTYVVEALLRKGANINSAASDGATPLHQAVIRRDIGMAQFLLEHGAQADIVQVSDNATPLHQASYLGDVGLVKLLLDKKADFNMKGPYQRTPLHFAVDQDHIDVVRELVNRGADLSLKDEGGMTALDLAKRHGFSDIVELINKAFEGRLALFVFLRLMMG